eukprot:GHVN01089122.1.p1 GENE.GHVN01089122.1~~GHVN01089122.1.p1  ORF type:complete len:371 (+),score=47.22 GHVN01089122.1:1350-2462(+)
MGRVLLAKEVANASSDDPWATLTLDCSVLLAKAGCSGLQKATISGFPRPPSVNDIDTAFNGAVEAMRRPNQLALSSQHTSVNFTEFFSFFAQHKVAQLYFMSLGKVGNNNAVFASGNNSCGKLGIAPRVEEQLGSSLFPTIQAKGKSRNVSITDKGSNRFFDCPPVDGEIEGVDFNFNPINIFALDNVKIVKVATGRDHTLFLDREGDVWVAGQGHNGALGLGGLDDRSRPTRMQGVSSIADVAAGARHSAAVHQDGRLLTWGSGDLGQLGLGKQTPMVSQVGVRECAHGREKEGLIWVSDHRVGYRYVVATRPIEIKCDLRGQADITKKKVNPLASPISSQSFFKRVECGDFTTICMTKDGQWGRNGGD